MSRPLKVHTIIMTEACPLACRYCDLRNDTCFGKSQSLTYDEVKATVAKYDEEDNYEVEDTRILFSGGEPFLYWDCIKEIIETYENRFQYAFNTSGYCFTEEMLEFLSHYKVTFVLSVDGDEKLTNYLRPLKSNPYKVGYMKQLKKIIPTMLYYFPMTPFRIIVNPRYVDLLYQQYLEAERLGFRYFTFILDFESRPDRNLNKDTIIWEEKHTNILQEQFDLIIRDIVFGFYQNVSKPRIVEMDKVLQYLLKPVEFSPENLPCKVFDGRTLNTLYVQKDFYCMSMAFPDPEDAKRELMEAYNRQNHQCTLDKECPAFDYCALHCCPQLGLTTRTGFFDFDPLECAINKVIYKSAIKLLYLSNELCPDAQLYKQFINSFSYEGKEEAINGTLLPL